MVGMPYSCRLRVTDLDPRTGCRLAADEAVELALRVHGHLRGGVVGRCPGAAHSSRIEHIQRRRAVDKIPVAVAVADPERRGADKAARRGARQRGVETGQTVLVDRTVHTAGRPTAENV